MRGIYHCRHYHKDKWILRTGQGGCAVTPVHGLTKQIGEDNDGNDDNDDDDEFWARGRACLLDMNRHLAPALIGGCRVGSRRLDTDH